MTTSSTLASRDLMARHMWRRLVGCCWMLAFCSLSGLAMAQTALNVFLPEDPMAALFWREASTQSVFAELGITWDATDPNEASMLLLDVTDGAQQPGVCLVAGSHHQTWVLRLMKTAPDEEGQPLTVGVFESDGLKPLETLPRLRRDELNDTWWLDPESAEPTDAGPVAVTMVPHDTLGELRRTWSRKQIDGVFGPQQIVDLLPIPRDAEPVDLRIDRTYGWFLRQQPPIEPAAQYHFVKACIRAAQDVQTSRGFRRTLEDFWRKRYGLSRNEAQSLRLKLEEDACFQPLARVPEAEALPPGICRDTHPHEMAFRLVPQRRTPIQLRSIISSDATE